MVNNQQLPKSSPFFPGQLVQALSGDLQLAGMSQWTVHG